jgi:F-type H+-transporting ATPase subunit beta
VLLFVDNIFRFTQAGSEVSALLGRIPSAVGYQPTLSTEMGALQERITSTSKGSVTSACRPSTCPPTTSPTPRRPPRSPTSTHHRALARDAELGIYPAVDPLDSTSTISTRRWSGKSTTRSPARAATLQRYKELQDIIAILGMDELSPEIDKLVVQPAPARSRSSCRSRSSSPSSSRAREGKSRLLADTVRASRRSSTASTTTCSEQDFYMVGGIDEVKAVGAEGGTPEGLGESRRE